MGPAEFNLIYPYSGLKVEPSQESYSKCRKRQNRTYSSESVVFGSCVYCCHECDFISSRSYIMLWHFHSQDYVRLSRILKRSTSDRIWGICMLLNTLEENLILLVFLLVGIKLTPTKTIHYWKSPKERYEYRKWLEVSREDRNSK